MRHDPPHRLDRRLARERGEIGADEAVGLARELVEIDVVAERHAAGVDAEDLAPAALVGHADDDLAVEPAGPAQRLVDRLGPVGGGDDDQILRAPRARPSASAAARRGASRPRPVTWPRLGAIESISSMKMIDGRRPGRLLEHLAQPLLALAIGRAHDLGAGDVEEIARRSRWRPRARAGSCRCRAGRAAARPWADRRRAARTVSG